jgi:hypothetical protein
LAVDPELVRAWLSARSVARGLPRPVADFGGFRVDTNGEKEVRRWVFSGLVDGIGDLGRSIHQPRHVIKLCGTTDELAAALPAHWTVEGGRWFMTLDGAPAAPAPLPPGYRLDTVRDGAVTKVEIRTESGQLAANGRAAETPDAFVYDRIETDVAHRRRGLARAVMAALGSCRESQSAPQLLIATTEGEKLYSSMGWRKLSPYSTAYLPEPSASAWT